MTETTGPYANSRGEPIPGQCVLCGGRGGWWSSVHRETCTRCDGDGWDPARDEPWFLELIAPLQHG